MKGFCVYFFALAFGLPGLLSAQNGKLAGATNDRYVKRPLDSVNVIVYQNLVAKANVYSDLVGDYSVQTLTPGTYDVEYRASGYRSLVIRDVRINFETTTHLNASLSFDSLGTQGIDFEDYKVPLIESDHTTCSCGQRVDNSAEVDRRAAEQSKRNTLWALKFQGASDVQTPLWAEKPAIEPRLATAWESSTKR